VTATTSATAAVDHTTPDVAPGTYSGSRLGDRRVIGWAIGLTVAVPAVGALTLAVAGPLAAVLSLLAALTVACLVDTRWGPEERAHRMSVPSAVRVRPARAALPAPPVTVTAVAYDLPSARRALTQGETP
jgi:hypothetical protein